MVAKSFHGTETQLHFFLDVLGDQSQSLQEQPVEPELWE